MTKIKKFNRHKIMKEVSRQKFNVKPTKVLKNSKKRRTEKQTQKEIKEYLNDL